MADVEFEVYADDSSIEKPIPDTRKYRYLKLNGNDLRVLVVQDETTDKAAAFMNVNVGHFTDREYNTPGLAHFCEHLLFMGTEKFPKENEMLDYLAKNSGHSNAFTDLESTNYFFEVDANGLEGALDRWSQFFISPLFDKNTKDREIKAVDSENNKNLQNDMWRIHQLRNSTSNPAHPRSDFGTGNLQTLGSGPVSEGIDIREVLLKFYKDHYSSNIMNLVIVGKENLDTLTFWAVEKFSSIENKGLSLSDYGKKEVLTLNELRSVVKAKPVLDTRTLALEFEIPDDQDSNWKLQPARYFSLLLGHESKGSIIYLLKEKGWATALVSYAQKIAKGSSQFNLEITLTPVGLENWKQILSTVFQYIKLLNELGPQKWFWQEDNNVSKIQFKFKEPRGAMNLAMSLGMNLQKFRDHIPPKYLLDTNISREYDEAAILKYGSYLVPTNFRAILVDKELQGLDKKEKWYGTEYNIEKLSDEFIESLKNVRLDPDLSLPAHNNFIAENLDIISKKQEIPLKHPALIVHNNKYHIWYKKDDTFEVPLGEVHLDFHLPPLSSSAKALVGAQLWAKLLEDSLNDVSYLAETGKLKLDIEIKNDALEIAITGYNDKIPVFLETVLKNVFSFDATEERFNLVKYGLEDALGKSLYEDPYLQVYKSVAQLLNEGSYLARERFAELKELTFEDFKSLLRESFFHEGVFVEGLISGNFELKTAEEIFAHVEKFTLEIGSIDEDTNKVFESIRLRSVVLPPKENLRLTIQSTDPENVNSCIEYYIQVSPELNLIRLRVLILLLSTIISEPAFEQLRSREQLGYVVLSRPRITRSSLGLWILVQSERSSEYLEYRVFEFLKRFVEFVDHKLTDDEFKKYKEALKVTELKRLQKQSEEIGLFWSEIQNGALDFERRFEHVQVLQTIDKQEFVDFVDEYFRHRSVKAAKFVTHFKSQKVREQSRDKLIRAAAQNAVSDYELSQEVRKDVDNLLESENASIPVLAEKLAEILTDNSPKAKKEEKLAAKLSVLINERVDSPVPKDFLSSRELNTPEEFELAYPLGGKLKPVKDLSSFYYNKQDCSHL